jgi:hypothetical protein
MLKLLTGQFRLPRNIRHAPLQELPHVSDPTTEEIQQACLEIQANWSERKRRRRRQGSGTFSFLGVIASSEIGISE